MTTHTHQTAPTQFVEANGIRFAYRRFGKTGGVSIVMNVHFRGTMDHWDPAVTDGLALQREVILFDNAGISSSSGTVPETIEAMARDAIAFIGALGLDRVDLLGHSMGGLVAQEVALAAPGLARRLVLVGTGPRGGVDIGNLPGWVAESPDDFVARALAFAADMEALATLRQNLRRRFLASPLCDAPRFARNLEAAFEGMWQLRRGAPNAAARPD